MNAILRAFVERILFALVTLFFVSILIFSAVAALPGNFAETVLGQEATPETVAALSRQLGLDRSMPERYLSWIGGILSGHFGYSFSGLTGSSGDTSRTVISLIAPRLKNTLILAGFVAAIAVPLSLGLGLLTALYRNSVFDRAANVVTLAWTAVPEFFIAYVLTLFLSVRYPVFPSLSLVNPNMNFVDWATACALPAITLVFVTVAHLMRMTRASIINLLANQYIETARLKGISPSRIIFRHALPNAWAPIITVIALTLAYLIVGVVVVEVVFVYPGIGQLMVNSVSMRDVPVVQACGLIFAATYIFLNLVADIAVIVSNPRLLHRSQ